MRLLLCLVGVIVLPGCHPAEATRPRTSEAPSPTTQHRREQPRALMRGVEAVFSPDGKWLLTEFVGDNHDEAQIPPAWKEVTLWEVATGKVVKTFPEEYRGEQPIMLAFLPDGTRALSAGRGYWRVFEVPGGKVIRHVKVEQGIFLPADLSRDGKRLLSYGSLSGSDGLQLWDVDDGKVTWFRFTSYPVIGGQFSPDGKMALVASMPGEFDLDTLRLWDFERGREVFALKGGTATFMPNGKRFVAWEEAGLFLWDITAAKPVRKITIAWSNPMVAQAVTPDGKYLLVAAKRHLTRIDLDGDKVVWSAELVQEAPLYAQFLPHTVVFSPDRTVVLVAIGGQLQPNGRMDLALWDAARGERLRELELPE